MADWQLSFRHPETLTLEQCERVLVPFVTKITTTLGALEGNPRDFYSRSVTMKGRRAPLAVELTADQSVRTADDPEPILHIVYVRLSAPYATKLAAWQAMAVAFAALGCIDDTVQLSASAILGDAEAATDVATIARLRPQVGAALAADEDLRRRRDSASQREPAPVVHDPDDTLASDGNNTSSTRRPPRSPTTPRSTSPRPTRLDQLRAMVENGASRSAVTVASGHTNDGDAIVALIATPGAFPSLVELDLQGGSVTDRGLLALATLDCALDHLESIHLDGDDRDTVGVSARAVDTVARAKQLPALRTIWRNVTHHVYAAGSRDDREVTRIPRDDGRVVECVVYHQLWP